MSWKLRTIVQFSIEEVKWNTFCQVLFSTTGARGKYRSTRCTLETRLQVKRNNSSCVMQYGKEFEPASQLKDQSTSEKFGFRFLHFNEDNSRR